MFQALISGGNANNEANAGPLYANTNNSASNANTNIGAHLLQIEIGGEDKVIFTGSGMLKKQIEQINKEDFPFLATIENINETYQFQ